MANGLRRASLKVGTSNFLLYTYRLLCCKLLVLMPSGPTFPICENHQRWSWRLLKCKQEHGGGEGRLRSSRTARARRPHGRRGTFVLTLLDKLLETSGSALACDSLMQLSSLSLSLYFPFHALRVLRASFQSEHFRLCTLLSLTSL